jgi:hypothetical protein
MSRFNPLASLFNWLGLAPSPHHHFKQHGDTFGAEDHLLSTSHTHGSYHGMQMQQAHGPMVRSRLNAVGVFVAVAVPFAFFMCASQLMSSIYYYQHPESALLLVVGAVLLVLAMAPFALQSKRRMMSQTNTFKQEDRGSWWSFIFFSSAILLALGLLSGHINYRMHTRRYYDYMSLRKDVDVDPAVSHGQQEMDAGQIDFKKGTTVDTSLTGVYHKTASWCVAPLTSYNRSTQLGAYDFWAVGMDCCTPMGNSDHQGYFSCGPKFGEDSSPSGVRVLDAGEIVGYTLAVQQASAQHGIQSRHPIFLYMTKHPWEQIKVYAERGLLWAEITGLIAFLGQCIMVYSEAQASGTGEPSGYLDMESKVWQKHFLH